MATEESTTERIDIRTTPSVKEILQKAALAVHKSVSEFLLDAGLEAAKITLSDRQIFPLDEVQWQAFQEALVRPVQDKPRLSKLLSEPSILE